MIKTYYDRIKETIQQHPEIHPAVVADILYRCRDTYQKNMEIQTANSYKNNMNIY